VKTPLEHPRHHPKISLQSRFTAASSSVARQTHVTPSEVENRSAAEMNTHSFFPTERVKPHIFLRWENCALPCRNEALSPPALKALLHWRKDQSGDDPAFGRKQEARNPKRIIRSPAPSFLASWLPASSFLQSKALSTTHTPRFRRSFSPSPRSPFAFERQRRSLIQPRVGARSRATTLGIIPKRFMNPERVPSITHMASSHRSIWKSPASAAPPTARAIPLQP